MRNSTGAHTAWQLTLLWALLMAVSLATRSYMPIDETRYVTVAWEMWLRGDFLVPHLNGATYSHKPPLLFWIYQFGWWLFGVNDWWPRLVAPLFGLSSVGLTFLLARRLWPENSKVPQLASWLLFGSVFWTAYTTAAMFDMLVTFFALLGLYGLWSAGEGKRSGWLWFGLAIGLGILAKGPVILLHTLPAALLGPWWSDEARHHGKSWYLHLLGAFLFGVGIALSWAIPAALHGGKDYADAIFWGQTANRMVKSFAHRRAFWWYLPLLPLIFYPWFWWPPVWKGLRRFLMEKRQASERFCLAWLLPGFLFLTLISGKQAHYLLPLFPAVALLAAKGLDGLSLNSFSFRLPALLLALTALILLSLPWWSKLPEWKQSIDLHWGALLLLAGLLLAWLRVPRLFDAVRILALASVMLVISGYLYFAGPLRQAYDVTRVAKKIGELQTLEVPLTHESKYAGQYHFLGRLKRPLQWTPDTRLRSWAERHPDGYLILYLSPQDKIRFEKDSLVIQPYRGKYVAIVPARVYLEKTADR